MPMPRDIPRSHNSTEKVACSPFAQEAPELLQRHFDHLLASAISVDVIRERGYRSVLSKRELADIGFFTAQQVVPGILIPLHGTDGTPAGWQYRPDRPRLNRRGRVIKYENVPHSSVRLDCPPQCRPMLGDPLVPILFSEGVKKADALASRQCCAIALTGVWNFKGKNPLGGTTVLADFDYIALKGRECYVLYDSDYADNSSVRNAQERFSQHLRRKGAAKVNVVHFPAGPQGRKVDVNDYLAEGHTVEELVTLAVPLEEVREEEEKEAYSCYAYYMGKVYLEIRRLDGSYAFAYLKDAKIELTPEIATGGVTLRPRPLPVREGRTLDFVGLPDENIMATQLLSPGELYRQIKAHFCKFVDLTDLDLELCIYYCIFTWFYSKVNTVGYLRFLADTGKGKTRLQKVVGDLCFYPMYASGASSFSGMARQQDKWRGTLVIDESDTQGDKEAQFIKYLNLGFERGKIYVLSDKQNPKRQEFFEPFSPKILAMREPFSDPATESRMLSVSPYETSNPTIPIILLSNYWQEMQSLRNKLARFTLEHWNETDGEKLLDFRNLGIEPRLQQLAMPTSIIFQLWPQGVERFKRYLIARQHEVRKLRAQSWQGSLFNLIYSIAIGDFDLQGEFVDYYEPQRRQIQAVTPSMVARQMKSSAKAVTQSLTSIGFQVERRIITIYSKDDTENGGKTRVVRCYTVPSQRAWDEMVSRYYYQEDEGESDIDTFDRFDGSAYTEVELPAILESKKFVHNKKCVCGDLSKVSKVSKNPLPLTPDDEKDSKNAIGSGAVEPVQQILGMTREEALSIWDKQGKPTIHLGASEDCHDLAKLLGRRDVEPRHLSAIRAWLERGHKAEGGRIT